jgi:hypothetical protein
MPQEAVAKAAADQQQERDASIRGSSTRRSITRLDGPEGGGGAAGAGVQTIGDQILLDLRRRDEYLGGLTEVSLLAVPLPLSSLLTGPLAR